MKEKIINLEQKRSWTCKVCGNKNRVETQICIHCEPLHTTEKTLRKNCSCKVCDCRNK